MIVKTIGDIYRTLGYRGNAAIVEICMKPATFTELLVKTKLNPSVVNRGLKNLQEAKIIEHRGNNYMLTDLGWEIQMQSARIQKHLDGNPKKRSGSKQ